MRCVQGVAAAAAVAATLCLTVNAAPASPLGEGPSRFLIFGGVDMWRHGVFAYDGMVWSPGGVDREGFTLKMMSGAGLYTFRSGTFGGHGVIGRELNGSILPGWRFVRGPLFVTVMAGLDVQEHRLFPDDPHATLRGLYYGLRAGFELWYEPTAATMLSADASVSAIGPGYSARAAFGWRVLDRFYLGPELQAYATGNNHNQMRAGVHLTALRTGRFEWSAAFGWATDSDRRRSTYGRLGVFTRR